VAEAVMRRAVLWLHSIGAAGKLKKQDISPCVPCFPACFTRKKSPEAKKSYLIRVPFAQLVPGNLQFSSYNL
jgi:hypothetical protein